LIDAVMRRRSTLGRSMTGEEDFSTDALAALTPAKRLKEVNKQIPRKARDFACGLTLRSRPQSGST
jgi:hypothetical protein